MSDEWEDVSCADRPQLPLFPYGLAFFKTWKTLRWFLLFLLPVLSSAAAACLRERGLFAAMGVLLLGPVVTAVLFVQLCSRISSSNWGTFYRRREPIRYWFAVGWVALFYMGLSVIGYIAW